MNNVGVSNPIGGNNDTTSKPVVSKLIPAVDALGVECRMVLANKSKVAQLQLDAQGQGMSQNAFLAALMGGAGEGGEEEDD